MSLKPGTALLTACQKLLDRSKPKDVKGGLPRVRIMYFPGDDCGFLGALDMVQWTPLQRSDVRKRFFLSLSQQSNGLPQKDRIPRVKIKAMRVLTSLVFTSDSFEFYNFLLNLLRSTISMIP